ncbi:hypothetical protein GCM10010483_17000 [Actinokineospora diospyrosa]
MAGARRAAGFTQETLAAALGVDRTTVQRWESRTREPLPHVRPRLARLIGVSLTELDAMIQEGAVERRGFLAGAVFSAAASLGPSREWLVASLEEFAGPPAKVGSADVAALRQAFSVFQELDVMRGGGCARAHLGRYLEQVVAPLVEATAPHTPVGKELYSAVSEQHYLLGWMAFDDGDNGFTQAHLLRALRLAQAAGDVDLGAHVLAGLSDQATTSGHPQHGLRLARTGLAGQTRSSACVARLRALEARAAAAVGDEREARRSVELSQQEFANKGDEPEWARFIDTAYLAGEYAHVFRDLGLPEAKAFARESAAAAELQGRARRGALAAAALARAEITAGDVEAAAGAAGAALRLAVKVQSKRSVAAVRDLEVRLRPYQSTGAVREFVDGAAILGG